MKVTVYDGCRACVRWGKEVGEYFEVERVLRLGIIISPVFSLNEDRERD